MILAQYKWTKYEEASKKKSSTSVVALIRVPHPTSVKLAAENQYRAPYRSTLAPSMITGVSFNGRWVFGDPMLLEVEIDVPKLTGSQ